MYFVFINDTISTTMWVLQVHHVRVHSFRATHRRTGSHQKTFVSFTQPLCQCARAQCVSFFSWRAVQQTLSVQGLERLLDQTSSCTDQMALLSGHSSLFADLEFCLAAWPHLIGLAGGAKVDNGNTQRHFRVVRCMCALNENDVDIKCFVRERCRSARFQCSRCLSDTERCQRTPH